MSFDETLSQLTSLFQGSRREREQLVLEPISRIPLRQVIDPAGGLVPLIAVPSGNIMTITGGRIALINGTARNFQVMMYEKNRQDIAIAISDNDPNAKIIRSDLVILDSDTLAVNVAAGADTIQVVGWISIRIR